MKQKHHYQKNDEGEESSLTYETDDLKNVEADFSEESMFATLSEESAEPSTSPSASPVLPRPIEDLRHPKQTPQSLHKRKAVAERQAQARVDALMKASPFQPTDDRIGLEIKAVAYIKGKPGSSAAYDSLIKHILTPAGAIKTQAKLQQYAKEQFPNYSPPKDWNRPFQHWAIRRIKSFIDNSPAPISAIKIPQECSLNQLHRLAKAALEGEKADTEEFRPSVKINHDSVVINGHVFNYKTNKGTKKNYYELRVSKDTLIKALRQN